MTNNTFPAYIPCNSELTHFHTELLRMLCNYVYKNEKAKQNFTKPSKELLKSFIKFIQEHIGADNDSLCNNEIDDTTRFVSFYQNLRKLIDEECEKLILQHAPETIYPDNKYIKESAVYRGDKMQKLKDKGYTVKQIGIIFNMSRQNVENMLIINGLAPEIKNGIETKKITATAALELKNLSHENQIALINMLNKLDKKPTVANIKKVINTGAFMSCNYTCH